MPIFQRGKEVKAIFHNSDKIQQVIRNGITLFKVASTPVTPVDPDVLAQSRVERVFGRRTGTSSQQDAFANSVIGRDTQFAPANDPVQAQSGGAFNYSGLATIGIRLKVYSSSAYGTFQTNNKRIYYSGSPAVLSNVWIRFNQAINNVKTSKWFELDGSLLSGASSGTAIKQEWVGTGSTFRDYLGNTSLSARRVVVGEIIGLESGGHNATNKFIVLEFRRKT